MLQKVVYTLAIAAGVVDAQVGTMLRFPCAQLTVERLDPIVNPGAEQTAHLHQIIGGNAFRPTMDAKMNFSTEATCTSCLFTEDNSNYWTAVMYYKSPHNGTFKRVPTYANENPMGINDGMTVYYIPDRDRQTKVKAFAPGFRMIVGDPENRQIRAVNTQGRIKQVSFRCWTKGRRGGGAGAPGSGTDTEHFPNKPCEGGIRANIYFPTCWDGKTLDPPDHRSHMAYPTNNKCPSTHPVKVPQILYETAWDTTAFNNPADWPTDGSQPFVFSTGDPGGYGQHGDYVFGWKGDSLQRAMDARCGGQWGGECRELTRQTAGLASECKLKPRVPEEISKWSATLPGDSRVH